MARYRRRARGSDWSLTPALLTTPQASAYTQVKDFTTGVSPSLATFASATGASATTSGGKTRLGWTSATVGQYTGVKLEGSWDFSTSDLFALDVAQPWGFDQVAYLDIWLCFDTGTTFTNYARKVGVYPVRRGTIALRKSDFTVTGSAAWSAVRRIEIRFQKISAASLSTSTSVVDLYGFYSHVTPPKTKVVLSFDDGAESQYTKAFDYMQTKGLQATAFFNADRIGDAGYCTLAHLREMAAAGWELSSHTNTHVPLAIDLTVTRSGGTVTATTGRVHGLSVSDSVTIEGGDQPEYTGTFTVATVPTTTSFTYSIGTATPTTPGTGKRWMALASSAYQSDLEAQIAYERTNAVRPGSGVFAYPFGYYSTSSLAVLASLGYVAARTVETYPAPHTAGAVATYLGLLDPMRVPTIELADTTTAAGVLASVDSALPYGYAVNLYGHKVEDVAGDATTMPTAEFNALMDGLAERRDAGTIDVVPFRRWIQGG